MNYRVFAVLLFVWFCVYSRSKTHGSYQTGWRWMSGIINAISTQWLSWSVMTPRCSRNVTVGSALYGVVIVPITWLFICDNSFRRIYIYIVHLLLPNTMIIFLLKNIWYLNFAFLLDFLSVSLCNILSKNRSKTYNNSNFNRVSFGISIFFMDQVLSKSVQ